MKWFRKIDLVALAMLVAATVLRYRSLNGELTKVDGLVFGAVCVIYVSFYWKRPKPTRKIDPTKKKFLVGNPGNMDTVWAIFYARSAKDIVRKYPNARVFEDRPEGMDDYAYGIIEAGGSFDIDGDMPSWFPKKG